MNVLTAALLGLIQGLAEFLPISSSGHLNLLQALFGVDVEHQLLFNILLHVGTLVAVAIVFWKDWVAMIAHPIKNHTLVLLFIASLPALAGKILFDKPLDYVETHNSLLGVCFLITALLLVLTQWLSRRNALRGVEKHRVGVGEALAMGCLQAVGMLPGVSRSGSTIFGGVAARLDRETAAKFSFMMSAPAIVGGLVSEGMDVLKEGVNIGPDLPAILVGMAVAGVSGYLAIRFFLRLISRVSLNGFAVYVAVLGRGKILENKHLKIEEKKFRTIMRAVALAGAVFTLGNSAIEFFLYDNATFKVVGSVLWVLGLAALVVMLVLSIVFTDRKAAAEEQRRQDEEMIRKERSKMRAAFEFDDEDDDKPESDNKTDGE